MPTLQNRRVILQVLSLVRELKLFQTFSSTAVRRYEDEHFVDEFTGKASRCQTILNRDLSTLSLTPSDVIVRQWPGFF